MKGTITVVKRAKPGTPLVKGCGSGYGFIRDEAGQDRFFHSNSVEGDVAFADLQEGTKVVFEPYEEPRGLRARRVVVSA